MSTNRFGNQIRIELAKEDVWAKDLLRMMGKLGEKSPRSVDVRHAMHMRSEDPDNISVYIDHAPL